MNTSLGSLGDFPNDDDKQNAADQTGSDNPARDEHLFTLQQIHKRLTLGPISRRNALPRSIPAEVLVQLDKLLDQAVQSMVEGKEPAILSPMMWDVILILNRTGIRCSELTHLEAPSGADRQGCLELDSSGSWWLLVRAAGTKANKDYRIPILAGSGVIEAVRRQCLRISDMPDKLGERYLFRDEKGFLSSTAIRMALKKLSKHLTHEGQPYVIAVHQFRHTLAQNMFALSAFMGHASPSVCQYYPSRSASLLKERDRLREKWEKLQHDEERLDEKEQSSQEGEQQGEEQEGPEE